MKGETRRIKVFIAAYINQTNSQNLSCRALVNHINKNEFEVFTLAIGHGNLPYQPEPGVHVFRCFYPVKFTGIFGFLWGIWNCDVCYLAKGNMYRWERRFLKLFRRKSFKTVEIVFDDMAFQSAAYIFRNIKVKEAFDFVDRAYSLSAFMREYNYKRHGLETSDRIVPLVNDTSLFSKHARVRTHLTGVVFLGNDFKRKGVIDFIGIARQFPALIFHIIGRGDGIKRSELDVPGNVKIHGMLAHEVLIDVLDTCQLHILPSRSEGFPKVVIEMAAMGIPTLTYSDYGASEWIAQGENGYVVSTRTEMVSVVKQLTQNDDELRKCSEGALAMASDRNIDKATKIYESIIEELYHEK